MSTNTTPATDMAADTVQWTAVCPACDRVTVVEVCSDALVRWNGGAGGEVRELFPMLTFGEQCVMESSGWHPGCWDAAATPVDRRLEPYPGV